MTMHGPLLPIIRQFALAMVLFGAPAAFSQPAEEPVVCAADATVASEKLIESCTVLINAESTAAAVRINALVVRAGVFDQIYQTSRDATALNRAIADYDAVLKLDPRLVQAYASRGNAWREKGDRRRALADYSAVLRLDPSHQAVAAQRRELALEIERLGATMPVKTPAADCVKGKDCPR